MPGWLQAFAKINPITLTVDALRALCLGGPTATHVWLLEVMPWIASTGSRCSLVPPIRNVASDPPGTRTSVLAVDDKRTLLLIDAGIRRHRRREFIRPLSH